MSRSEIGAARSQRTKANLLAAAARVIANRGEEAATIEDFIAEARVTRGTFYRHFRTRHELFEALWTHVGWEPFADIARAYANVNDVAERVMIGSKQQMTQAARDHAWGWLVVRIVMTDDELFKDVRALALADVEKGRLSGRFLIDDSEAAVDVLFGAQILATKTLLTRPCKPDYIETVCKMLLQALGLKEAEAARIAAMPLPLPLRLDR